MSELPQGWAASTIGDCFLDIRNGTTATQNAEGKGLPVSRIETIQNRQFDLNRIRHIAYITPEAIKSFRYQVGDIAFSHINSYEHVGKTALYQGKPELLIHGMNLLRIRMGHSEIDPAFAYLYMQSQHFREEVRHRVGHAVNQVSINQKNLVEVPFVIPPLNEQRRIVAKLEELLARVDASQQRLGKVPVILKRFRQAVLAAACSGRLTADWREENGFGEGEDLPEGWETLTLADCCCKIIDGNYGADYPKANEFIPTGVPFFTSAAIGENGNVIEKEVRFISREKHRLLKKAQTTVGDVLFTNRGARVGATTLLEDQTYAISNIGPQVTRLASNTKLIVPKYLLNWMRSPFFLEVMRDANGGSAMNFLNLTVTKSLPIYLPPLPEQQEIVRRVESFFTLADQLEARYRTAKTHVDKLTQSILAKAFRGELVPQDPNDEPASVLLERIKAKRAKASPTPARRRSARCH